MKRLRLVLGCWVAFAFGCMGWCLLHCESTEWVALAEPCEPASTVRKTPELLSVSTGKPLTNFTHAGRIHAMAVQDTSLWLGTDGGLYELNAQSGMLHRVLTTADGLTGNRVSDVRIREGQLWAVTGRGVSKVDLETGTIVSRRVDMLAGHFLRMDDGADLVVWGGDKVLRLHGAPDQWQVHQLPRGCEAVALKGDTAWVLWEPREVRHGEVACRRSLLRLGLTTGDTKRGDGPPVVERASWFRTRPAGAVFAGSVWVLSGHELFRVSLDCTRWEPVGRGAGLPPGDVEALVAHGDSLWALAGVEYDPEVHTVVRATLCRFRASTGQWRACRKIGRHRFDQPTWLGVLDDELWVATRSYDTTVRTVLAWGMVPMERRFPKTEELTLARWDAVRDRWACYHVPAVLSTDQFSQLAKTSGTVWARRHHEDPRPRYPNRGESLGPLYRLDLATGNGRWYRGLVDAAPDRGFSSQRRLQAVQTGQTCWLDSGLQSQLARIEGEMGRLIRLPSSLPSPTVTALACVEGTVFVGTARGEVLRWDEAGRRLRLVCAPEYGAITSLAGAPGGGLLIGCCRDDVLWHPNRLPHEDQARPGVPGGLFRWREGRLEVPSASPWIWVHHSARRTGIQWMQAAAEPGRQGRGRSGYEASMAPREQTVTRWGDGVADLAVDGDEVFVATFGQGLFRLHEDRWEQLLPPPPKEEAATSPIGQLRGQEPRPPSGTVTSLAIVGDTLWAATYAGLYRYSLTTEAWKRVPPEKLGYESSTSLHSSTPSGLKLTGPVVCGAAERLWFGSRRATSESPGTHVGSPDKDDWRPVMPPTPGRCFAQQGTSLWIGGHAGLVRVDAGTGVRRSITDHGLPNGFVRCLAVQGNHLWVGTDNGLTRIDTRRL